jgi:hypothetical protein
VELIPTTVKGVVFFANYYFPMFSALPFLDRCTLYSRARETDYTAQLGVNMEFYGIGVFNLHLMFFFHVVFVYLENSKIPWVSCSLFFWFSSLTASAKGGLY